MVKRLLATFIYSFIWGAHITLFAVGDSSYKEGKYSFADEFPPPSYEKLENFFLDRSQSGNSSLRTDIFNDAGAEALLKVLKDVDPNELSLSDLYMNYPDPTVYSPHDENVWQEAYQSNYRHPAYISPFDFAICHASVTNNLFLVNLLLKNGVKPEITLTPHKDKSRLFNKNVTRDLKFFGKKEETISVLPLACVSLELTQLLVGAGADPYKISFYRPLRSSMPDVCSPIIPQWNMIHIASGNPRSNPEVLEWYLNNEQAHIDEYASFYYEVYTDFPDCVTRTPISKRDAKPGAGRFSVLLEHQTPLACVLYALAANLNDKNIKGSAHPHSYPDGIVGAHFANCEDMFKKFKTLVQYGADPTIKQRVTTFAYRDLKIIYKHHQLSPLEFIKQQRAEHRGEYTSSSSGSAESLEGNQYYSTLQKIQRELELLTYQYEKAKALVAEARASALGEDINKALTSLRALRGKKFHTSSWVVRTIKELKTMKCVTDKISRIEALDGR